MRNIEDFGQSGKTTSKIGSDPVRIPTQQAFTACQDLETYWTDLRGSQIVPARMQFDPRGIERTLSNTFVAERVARNVVRIRVAGSSLNTLLGMDVRGMPVSAFFDPDCRDKMADAMQGMFDTPSKVTIDLSSPARLGRRAVRARLLLLPMSDVHGEINRVVGCLETLGEPITTARRFVVDDVRSDALFGEKQPSSSALHRDGDNFKGGSKAPEYAFADRRQADYSTRNQERADNVSRIRATPSRAHLRLVVDNK